MDKSNISLGRRKLYSWHMWHGRSFLRLVEAVGLRLVNCSDLLLCSYVIILAPIFLLSVFPYLKHALDAR